MNSGGSNNKRKGQGKKVDDQIAKVIRESMISMWIRGKRGRQLSAESVLLLISEEQPELVDDLPSLPTVRRIIKLIKERLNETPGDQENPWNLGSSTFGGDSIDDEALPLLLAINKAMALDVGEDRRRSGFKPNRLTVREARWVSKLRWCLPIDKTSDRNTVSAIEARVLTDFARRFGIRELAAHIEGSELDTYDLDMEIAYNAVSTSRNRNDFSLWALSAELGLVPMAGTRSSVEEALNRPNEIGATPPLDTGSRMNDLKEQSVKAFVARAVTRLNQEGTVVRIHFGTEDWAEGGWFNLEPFSTSVDYEITTDVLRLILPLARIDRVLTAADPRQVRIATAFFKKVTTELGKVVATLPDATTEQ